LIQMLNGRVSRDNKDSHTNRHKAGRRQPKAG
jgi:hypothetical protein